MTNEGKGEDVNASTRDEAETYYAEIRDDRNSASQALSTQIRSTVLAVLALTWLLLSGTESALETRFACFGHSLMWLAAACVCALVADFLQGVCNVYETNRAVHASADAISDGRYDDVGYDGSSLRGVSTVLYVAKCVLVVIAAIWLIVLIYRSLNGACLTICG